MLDQQLIVLVNRLQDAFTTVGIQNPIDLPQITVLGSQSSCVNRGAGLLELMLTIIPNTAESHQYLRILLDVSTLGVTHTLEALSGV
jgi:hypothetical protein